MICSTDLLVTMALYGFAGIKVVVFACYTLGSLDMLRKKGKFVELFYAEISRRCSSTREVGLLIYPLLLNVLRQQ